MMLARIRLCHLMIHGFSFICLGLREGLFGIHPSVLSRIFGLDQKIF